MKKQALISASLAAWERMEREENAVEYSARCASLRRARNRTITQRLDEACIISALVALCTISFACGTLLMFCLCSL